MVNQLKMILAPLYNHVRLTVITIFILEIYMHKQYRYIIVASSQAKHDKGWLEARLLLWFW